MLDDFDPFPELQVGSQCSSAGSARADLSRLVAALPFDAISNASSREIRLCANARASRAG